LQDQGAVVVAQSSVQNAKVNLGYCTITSPVDGVVIERDVDEGQTVASRAAAPTLFILGTDLTALQLIGEVDEADVAKVLPGQDVQFRVDAYPATFHGTVQSVRLNAVSTSNVVTYQVVISAPNPDLRLKPSMTANIHLETARATDVLRVSNLATRFHPTSEMFAAYHEPMPPPISMAAANLCAGVACAPPAGQSAAKPINYDAAPGTTIDTEFTPPPPTKLAGQVWVLDHDQLRRVPVELGVSDGTWTQIVSGDLHEGEEVLTAITLPGASAGANNPLLGNRGRGGGPGGFGPGGPGGFGPGR
jgi:HlyD family secretion protein